MKDPQSMESLSLSPDDALTTTLLNSVQALGRGFDVTSDIRLLYCKGAPGSRLVVLDDDHVRDLEVSDGVVLPSVSAGIECSHGRGKIEKTRVCSFHEVRVLDLEFWVMLFLVLIDLWIVFGMNLSAYFILLIDGLRALGFRCGML